jgi:hypothetical protein
MDANIEHMFSERMNQYMPISNLVLLNNSRNLIHDGVLHAQIIGMHINIVNLIGILRVFHIYICLILVIFIKN